MLTCRKYKYLPCIYPKRNPKKTDIIIIEINQIVPLTVRISHSFKYIYFSVKQPTNLLISSTLSVCLNVPHEIKYIIFKSNFFII